MRYHWGLGVGHLHAHHFTSTSSCIPDNNDADTQGNGSADLEPSESELGPSHESAHLNVEVDDTDHESDNSELRLDDRDLEGWQDVESNASEDDDNGEDDSKDMDSDSKEDFVGM
jgi:hypothetical protein